MPSPTFMAPVATVQAAAYAPMPRMQPALGVMQTMQRTIPLQPMPPSGGLIYVPVGPPSTTSSDVIPLPEHLEEVNQPAVPYAEPMGRRVLFPAWVLPIAAGLLAAGAGAGLVWFLRR